MFAQPSRFVLHGVSARCHAEALATSTVVVLHSKPSGNFGNSRAKALDQTRLSSASGLLTAVGAPAV